MPHICGSCYVMLNCDECIGCTCSVEGWHPCKVCIPRYMKVYTEECKTPGFEVYARSVVNRCKAELERHNGDMRRKIFKILESAMSHTVDFTGGRPTTFPKQKLFYDSNIKTAMHCSHYEVDVIIAWINDNNDQVESILQKFSDKFNTINNGSGYTLSCEGTTLSLHRNNKVQWPEDI